VDLSKSKLAQKHGPLAHELNDLLVEAETLGASSGTQRVGFICDQYDKLSPDVAYHWIDPTGLQNEIEDAQTHRIELVHILRNCISLLPLVLTWFALFSATASYQQCIEANQCDSTKQTFLALWQADGFRGRTFTFSIAALADVMLLLLYLSFIVFTYLLERRAHRTSIDFSQRLQATTEKLMKAIAVEGATPISSEADVDRVAQAVSQVVEQATEMNKEMLKSAKESVDQALQAAQQSTIQAIQAAQQSNLNAVQSIQQTINQALQSSQQSTQQIIESAQKAITSSNRQMEELFDREIGPMMKTFNTDMVSLHKELGSYQGRLNELTAASKQLSQASETLVKNADRYINIGKEISNQIAALNSTQQHVLSQIGAIAGNIGSAARDISVATASMSAATHSMSTATHAIESVAMQMTNGVQSTINTMTAQVGRASQSLGQVGAELQTTTYYLNKTATLLSTLQFGGRGGLLGWFFSRQQNRSKGAGAMNP